MHPCASVRPIIRQDIGFIFAEPLGAAGGRVRMTATVSPPAQPPRLIRALAELRKMIRQRIFRKLTAIKVGEVDIA